MIRRLSASVVDEQCSPYGVTSSVEAVLQLVYNSLDADASGIAVRVDLRRGGTSIQVVDNGSGIALENASLLATKYATSKDGQRSTIGFRGEALASIAELADSFSIDTRQTNATWTKRHKNSEWTQGITRRQRRCSGTTVTVRNLFRSTLVRQKHFDADLELENLTDRLTTLALWFHKVSFSLRNEATGQTLLRTHRTDGSLQTFVALFGRVYRSTPVRLCAANGAAGYSFSGFVGPRAHFNSTLRFLLVNGRPIVDSSLYGDLDALFARSSLCRSDDAGSSYPVYLIFVDCPRTDVTFTGGTAAFTKRNNLVAELLKWVAQSLIFNGFLEPLTVPSVSLTKTCDSKISEALMPNAIVTADTICDSKMNSVGTVSPSKSLSRSTKRNLITPAVAFDGSSVRSCRKHAVSKCKGNDTIVTPSSSVASLQPPRKRLCFDHVCTVTDVDDVDTFMTQLRKQTSHEDECDSSRAMWRDLCQKRNDTMKEQQLGNVEFSKAMLSKARVIGRLSNSVILCTMQDESNDRVLLTAIDSHAADERIRLEKLIEEYGPGGFFQSTPLTEVLLVLLNNQHCNLICQFQTRLQRYGFGFKLDDLEMRMKITSVPTLLLDEEKHDLKHGRDSRVAQRVLTIIKEFCENIRKSHANHFFPRTLRAILQLRVCEGALKFGGKQLTLAEAQCLLEKLSKCKTPSHCAHGRNLMYPLAAL